jgi:ABC-2 type transport system ATP-binding protein
MKPASLAMPVAVERAAVPSVAPALAVTRLVVQLPRGPLDLGAWSIPAGDTVALIGRNGVGKTSVVEALLGLRSGAVVEGRMLDADIAQWRRKPCLRKRLGVQLQRSAFPGRPRVSEIVALHRTLFDRTSEAVIAALGIEALGSRLYEFLSRGESQRVDLFLALAHEPQMLFLDEPFTGLDPQFARSLAALLRGMRRTTTLMCCHTAEELSLANRIAWLTPAGLRLETPDTLRRELLGEFRLIVDCEDEQATPAVAELIARDPRTAHTVSVEGRRITVAGPAQLADLARVLVDHPGVHAVDAGRSSLADLLRHCAREH